MSIDEVKPSEMEGREDFGNISCKFLITGETGSNSGCMFRATFYPGGFHARHLHRKSDEFVYIISGRGVKGIGNTE